MRNRIQGLLLGAMGIASAAFFTLSGASCGSAAIQCVAAHGSYIAKYDLVSGDAACLGLPGEEIGLSTYLGAGEKTADYNNRKLAVQSATLGGTLGELGTGDPAEGKPYAFGDYTTDPDANNICYAGGANGTAALAVAEINIAATDDGMGNTTPAIHLRQTWSNIRVYVTAAVPGTQMVGEMKFEDLEAGCEASYKVTGLFPAVPCGIDVDDDNDPMTDAADDDADTMNPDPQQPDNAACSPVADPASGRVFGSGINPDFSTTCDPTLLYCVLTTAPLTGAP